MPGAWRPDGLVSLGGEIPAPSLGSRVREGDVLTNFHLDVIRREIGGSA
jgi:hypothetical protein